MCIIIFNPCTNYPKIYVLILIWQVNKAKPKEIKSLAQVMKKKEMKISNKQAAGARFRARKKHYPDCVFSPKLLSILMYHYYSLKTHLGKSAYTQHFIFLLYGSIDFNHPILLDFSSWFHFCINFYSLMGLLSFERIIFSTFMCFDFKKKMVNFPKKEVK